MRSVYGRKRILRSSARLALLFVVLSSLLLACESDYDPEEAPPTPVELPPSPAPPAGGIDFNKFALWVDGPHLRGANVYQRRIYPELDGPDFAGPGPVGPPYTQEDFDRLSAMGANYVNLSHPGLFTEEPPYVLDPAIVTHLDELLAKIARADMFAVISFRTGPGRSEFTFFHGEDDDWFDASYYNDAVWEEAEAQEAWAEMWRYTAERYTDNPIVVGYDLMVEPNANEVGPDLWDPDEFYADYGESLYNWNRLYPRITAAVREADLRTPILIGGLGYSSLEWLPYLEPTGDRRTVYVFHQYAPFAYTHQEPNLWRNFQTGYPGEMDLDWDREEEPFDRAWLEGLLSTAEGFSEEHGVPVAVNEFGLMRWVPDAAAFMADEMALFEDLGFNYALWQWETSWPPYAADIDAFNFRHGSDPGHHSDVEESALMDVLVYYWSRNSVRPSTGGVSPRSAQTPLD
jgi:hypothetical protein